MRSESIYVDSRALQAIVVYKCAENVHNFQDSNASTVIYEG